MRMAVPREDGVASVSTGLRFERRLFYAHVESQAAHHVVEHVIVLVTQPTLSDLKRDVSIPEVIRRTRQSERVIGSHGRDGFRRSDDSNHATIVSAQQIAIAQHAPAFQEQTDLFARRERGAQAALRSQLERKYEIEVRRA